MMAKNKPGVMIYFETGRAIRDLTYEQKGQLFEAIMDYAELGVEPALDGVLRAVWPFIANAIDRDSQSYAKTIVGRKRAGYAKAWKDYARENGLDPQDKAAKERWIDEQMEKEAMENDANACNSMQMQANACNDMQSMPTPTPTPTSTPIPTPTPTTTTTRTTTMMGSRGKGVTTGAEKKAYGHYKNVFLTDEEYISLIEDIPAVDKVIENLSKYMQSSGRTYNDHEATIRKWASEDAEKAAAAARNTPTRKSGNVFYDLIQEGKVQ